MLRPVLILVILFCFVGCRKDPQLQDLPLNDIKNFCYKESSHLAPEPILKELQLGEVLGGPYYYILGSFFTYSVKFNPDNANQVVYIKQDVADGPNEKTIWFYDFCTKESRQIFAHCHNNITWGSGDKILCTALGYNVYMMNSWGEEVQQITESETSQVPGEFSPDNQFFFTSGNDGVRIFDINGNLTHFYEGYPPFRTIDWIDHEHLLVIDNSTSIYQSFNIQTEERIDLHANPQCNYCWATYVRELHAVYFIDHRHDATKGLYAFDIAKDQLTYLKELSSSYEFRSIDYNSDAKKFIFTLHQYTWKDSTKQQIYLKNDAIMLNVNGTNPRILDLPY